MGNGGSKPEQQVFSADAPVRFSQSVLDSLQRNPEVEYTLQVYAEPIHSHRIHQTDSTRAHDLELKVQSRVREELTRIRDQQSSELSHLTDSLTISPPKPQPSPSESTSTPSPPSTGLADHLRSPFYQDHSPRNPSGPSGAPPSNTPDSGRSSDSVKKEIMDLRQKLESRKKVESVPKAVEQAKEKVVQCLRTNDRRPLDCWKEVEEFKREVRMLEARFVARVGR
ncbi:hypothetical protein LTR35_000575 [Friedmanniomyces endolithicus]|uniref:DUF1690 domain-containing protein n=1 Tax=Friedmanniomyces endolithicus TaxID=329885 RepID=A0AAN6FCV4_9PEZI|nr:hypothetical protein LTS00_013986 [Friedmanniomyces endolithicus]KAK0292546.1 hypothetical protein LTR35_000575 [Friedmanniomyces endolithicus]KAK0309701.1 hypothetical protein LTR82_015054 [Friedmanniomyces endolithicus]KAK1007715.1 hypothetical protein LTR54_006443 [Friedmanniomyces endolithicus]